MVVGKLYSHSVAGESFVHHHSPFNQQDQVKDCFRIIAFSCTFQKLAIIIGNPASVVRELARKNHRDRPQTQSLLPRPYGLQGFHSTGSYRRIEGTEYAGD